MDKRVSVYNTIGMGLLLQILGILSSALWIKEYQVYYYFLYLTVIIGVIITLVFYMKGKRERIFWIIVTIIYMYVANHNFNSPSYLYNDLVLKRRIDNLYIYEDDNKSRELNCLSSFKRKWKMPFFFSSKSFSCYSNIDIIKKVDKDKVLVKGNIKDNEKVKELEAIIDIKTGKIISEKEK